MVQIVWRYGKMIKISEAWKFGKQCIRSQYQYYNNILFYIWVISVAYLPSVFDYNLIYKKKLIFISSVQVQVKLTNSWLSYKEGENPKNIKLYLFSKTILAEVLCNLKLLYIKKEWRHIMWFIEPMYKLDPLIL